MGKLTDFTKNYFSTTPEDQIRRDWEELRHYNSEGPDMLDVINNYNYNFTQEFEFFKKA